ncbi:MAG: aryl-sulfate sulfotransferase [Chloroflexota bacterium]
MRLLRGLVILSLAFLAVVGFAQEEQERTVGTLFGEHEGYTLMRTQNNTFVFLLNDKGERVHQWEVGVEGTDAFLMENGDLVITAPRLTPIEENDFAAVFPWMNSYGSVMRFTWEGEKIYEFELNRPDFRHHHGINVRPNGNIMMIAWDYKTQEEALQAGREPEGLGEGGLWSEIFLEYDPIAGEVVWEWHLWDHLIQDFDPTKDNYGVVADNPGKVNINYYDANPLIDDWIHANAINYNPVLDQIAISAREFNEVWIIDRSITTEEARGEAGELLYRWGHPVTYGRGEFEDRQLFYQHDVQWIPEGYPGAGNIIAYSNRHTTEEMPDGAFSTVVEITPPLQADGTYLLEEGQPYGPAEPTWQFIATPPESVFSSLISGTQRLRNGNTLITVGGEGRLLEVTPDNEIVWEYIAPYNGVELVAQGEQADARIFRARRYEADYPAFDGRDLTPMSTIEDVALEVREGQ